MLENWELGVVYEAIQIPDLKLSKFFIILSSTTCTPNNNNTIIVIPKKIHGYHPDQETSLIHCVQYCLHMFITCKQYLRWICDIFRYHILQNQKFDVNSAVKTIGIDFVSKSVCVTMVINKLCYVHNSGVMS